MASRSLNKVLLIGNLTRDPELRYTPTGAAVATFGLATNRSWVTESGERKEDAEFHNIVVWNKLAEICAEHLARGRQAYVEGRLSTREWEGQDGQKRRSTEVVADSVIFLGGPGGGSTSDFNVPDDLGMGGSDPGQAPQTKGKKPAKDVEPQKDQEVGEDIPF